MLALLPLLSSVPAPQILLPGPTSLPPSTDGLLALLHRIPADATAAPIPMARSYDGEAWEAVMPEPLDLTHCAAEPSTACAAILPLRLDGSSYQISWRGRSSPELPSMLASRFLSQSSFGPTRSTIEALAGAATTASGTRANFEAWLGTQMHEEAPSLHRAHYRARANPRVTSVTGTGDLRRACEMGSRWSRFAFSLSDVGKLISGAPVAASTGTITLSVDGDTRTQVVRMLHRFDPCKHSPLKSCTLV